MGLKKEESKLGKRYHKTNWENKQPIVLKTNELSTYLTKSVRFFDFGD